MQSENNFFSITVDNIPLGKFDLGGVLYHANYYFLYELTREAFLKNIGHSYHDLVKQGFHLAIVEAHQEFKKPIFYGDKIEIKLETSEIKNTSFKFHYQFFNNTITIHSGYTKHVLVDMKEKKISAVKINEKFSKGLNTILTS